MRLGYHCRTGCLTLEARGFNEAEAHAPRIRCALAACPKAGIPRFNEAEAHAPRIRQSLRLVSPARQDASMRPRRMRLGYAASDGRRWCRRVSFNEAEAHAPRIPRHPAGQSEDKMKLQ